MKWVTVFNNSLKKSAVECALYTVQTSTSFYETMRGQRILATFESEPILFSAAGISANLFQWFCSFFFSFLYLIFISIAIDVRSSIECG